MIVEGTTLRMTKGDSEGIKVSLRDIDGLAIPLEAGDTIYFTVKTSPYVTEKIFQKVATEFVDGVALLSIDPIDTKALKPRQYYYDVQLSRADGRVKTIIKPSCFHVEAEVTYE